MTNQTADLQRKLRWRCRRGMQELDVMLLRWLDDAWLEADEAQRRAFARLLEFEDDLLWDWLGGQTRPDDGLNTIVDEIRALSFSSPEH